MYIYTYILCICLYIHPIGSVSLQTPNTLPNESEPCPCLGLPPGAGLLTIAALSPPWHPKAVSGGSSFNTYNPTQTQQEPSYGK